MSEKKCPISFNSIANVLATVSAVGISGIIATGAYVYVNKDAIIDLNHVFPLLGYEANQIIIKINI